MIEDGKNGKLIPVNDVDGLVEAANELLEDDVLRKNLGKAGRDVIVQRHDPQNELNENLKLYQKLLKQKL